MSFSSLNNNNHIQDQLNNLLKSNRMPHAIIIDGGSSKQREDLTLLLSMEAVCTEKNKPCGSCNQCIKAKNNNHSDIYIAKGSGKTDVISIAEIRNITKDSVIIPNESKTKVYIFNNADKRMHTESQNAFLKTLEEPPQNILFILTCENSSFMLPTILSRTTVFKLTEENIISKEVLTVAQNIVSSIVQTKEIHLLLNISKLNNKNAIETLPVICNILRDCLSLQCNSNALTDKETAEKVSKVLTKKSIIELIDTTNLAITKINQNVNINLLTTWLCGQYRRIAWQR